MSDAIKELHDHLAKSPSVVYPQDVLEYLPAIEAENAKLRKDAAETALMLGGAWKHCSKLRELVRDMWRDIPKSKSCGWDTSANCCSGSDECKGECAYWYRMRELGVEE